MQGEKVRQTRTSEMASKTKEGDEDNEGDADKDAVRSQRLLGPRRGANQPMRCTIVHRPSSSLPPLSFFAHSLSGTHHRYDRHCPMHRDHPSRLPPLYAVNVGARRLVPRWQTGTHKCGTQDDYGAHHQGWHWHLREWTREEETCGMEKA